MFKGYPGETAGDLHLTADFLETHAPYLGRVRFNDFSILENTPIWNDVFSTQGGYPEIRIIGQGSRHARTRYENIASSSPAYRCAKKRVLTAVYAINRQRLRPEAQMFDGLM